MGEIGNSENKFINMQTNLSEILQEPQKQLDALEDVMGKKGVLEQIAQENSELMTNRFQEVGISENPTVKEVSAAFFLQIERHEQELYKKIGVSPEKLDFHKIADAARKMASESDGFFLKKEFGRQILRQRPHHATLAYLGYTDVEELLRKEDIGEIFSALRFIESDEWMHKTFAVAYTKFSPKDFEHRPIEIRVLGPQWEEVAKKYVAKKHHNVSHLKEFGIIFLNPIAQTGKGKFLRDFALLLHYFHEVAFYSRLFQKYAQTGEFQQKFIALLRGDVLENPQLREGDWLLVQRYLWKENPRDMRLLMPRVNPESLHWWKAEQDLARFGKENPDIGLEFWDGLDAVAGLFPGEEGDKLISLDMEDFAMSYVSSKEGKYEHFSYHQREALWNKIFARYVGGYGELERLVIENMGKGFITIA